MKILQIAIAAVLGMLGARVAAAESSALVFEGKAESRDAKLVTKTATTVLAEAQWQFIDATFTPKEVKAMSHCLSTDARAACVEVITKKKKVARVAIFSLETHRTAQGEDELVISAQLLVPGDNTFASEQRFCVHCTDDTIESNTRELTKKLLDQLGRDRGRTILAVTSEPSNAGVFVDNESVGITEIKTPISPGAHRIRVELNGYNVEERTIVGVEGKTSVISLQLVKIGTKGPDASAKPLGEHGTNLAPSLKPAEVTSPQPATLPVAQRSTVVPKLVVGFGATALIAGGAMIAFNQDSRTVPANQEQPRYYHPTLYPGVALASGGVLAVGIGVYLWRRKSPTAPAITFVQGGAVMGLSRGF